MFQAVTMTDAQSVWVDSPSEDRLGFGASSRVQITANPDGLVDWREPGDGYEVALTGGLWPDDNEIRCMVLGVVPGSAEAEAFMSAEAMRKAVQIMPLFGGCTRRMVFVADGTPRYVPNTVAPGTAAISSKTLVKMGFGEWRLMLDLALRKAGLPMTEAAFDTVTMDELEQQHDNGTTIEEAVHEYRRRSNQPVSDQHDAGTDTD